MGRVGGPYYSGRERLRWRWWRRTATSQRRARCLRGRQDLRPGEYRTDVFKPALSFTVGKGWALECPEGDLITCACSPREKLTLFKFLSVAEVYKPSELIDMSGETTLPPAGPGGLVQATPLPANR